MTKEEIEKSVIVHLGLIGIDAKSLDKEKKMWRNMENICVAVSAMQDTTKDALEIIRKNEILPETVAAKLKEMGLSGLCCATIYNNPDTYKKFIESFADSTETKDLRKKIADLNETIADLNRQVDLMSKRDSVFVKMNLDYQDLVETAATLKKDNDALEIENAEVRKQLEEGKKIVRKEIKPAVVRLPKAEEGPKS